MDGPKDGSRVRVISPVKTVEHWKCSQGTESSETIIPIRWFLNEELKKRPEKWKWESKQTYPPTNFFFTLLLNALFITLSAWRLYFIVDALVMIIQRIFRHELLSTNVAIKVTSHFSEICCVLMFLRRPAGMNWHFCFSKWVLTTGEIFHKMGAKFLLMPSVYYGKK